MPMKRIHSPFHGRPVVLGSRKRPASPPKLRLSKYLRAGAALPAGLPTPPPTIDLTPKAQAACAQMYLNDALGDCVVAGGYHVTGVATGNATGSPFIASDAQIIADYSAIGGYVPGNPATDQGCDEGTALEYWRTHGFANGTKLIGYMGVDATNREECALALWLFENLYNGLELPAAWVSPFPSAPGFVWDVAGDPDPENGHCIIEAGMNAAGDGKIITWGMDGWITAAARAKYCVTAAGGELWTMVTPDIVARGQSRSPDGVNWVDLLEDFAALGGSFT